MGLRSYYAPDQLAIEAIVLVQLLEAVDKPLAIRLVVSPHWFSKFLRHSRSDALDPGRTPARHGGSPLPLGLAHVVRPLDVVFSLSQARSKLMMSIVTPSPQHRRPSLADRPKDLGYCLPGGFVPYVSRRIPLVLTTLFFASPPHRRRLLAQNGSRHPSRLTTPSHGLSDPPDQGTRQGEPSLCSLVSAPALF